MSEDDEPARRSQAAARSTGTATLRDVGEGCIWLIAIGVVVYFGVQLAAMLRLVVLPVFLALVLAALLAPLVRRLTARGCRRWRRRSSCSWA